MLSKQHKLSRRLFPPRTGIRSSSNGVVLRIFAYLPALSADTLKQADKKDGIGSSPRFAVVVSKKSSTSAVKRNMFKRQVMEVIGQHMTRFRRLSYQKYVLLPKGDLRAITRELIKKDVETFLLQQQPR